jgi:hypothetical protein
MHLKTIALSPARERLGAPSMPSSVRTVMHAITVRDADADIAGLSMTGLPYPQTAGNDVIVGGTPQVSFPESWTGRAPDKHIPGITILGATEN